MSFTDPALEKRFLRKQYKDNLAYNRLLALPGLIVFSGFYLMNYIIMPPADVMLYAIPYVLGLAGFTLFIALTSFNISHGAFNMIGLGCMVMINLAPLISLMAYEYPSTLFFHCGCLFLATVGIVFTRISYYYTMAFAAIFMLLFVILYVSMGPHTAVETYNLSYLLAVAMGVGLVVAYGMEKRERINFIKLRIIIEERMKLSRLKDARPDVTPKTKK